MDATGARGGRPGSVRSSLAGSTAGAAATGAAPRDRAPANRVWWGGFALFGVLGVIWSLGIPLGEGPDEAAHVVKAAAVVRGQTQTSFERGPTVLGGTVPRTPVRLPAAYDELNARNRCFRPDLSAPPRRAFPR